VSHCIRRITFVALCLSLYDCRLSGRHCLDLASVGDLVPCDGAERTACLTVVSHGAAQIEIPLGSTIMACFWLPRNPSWQGLSHAVFATLEHCQFHADLPASSTRKILSGGTCSIRTSSPQRRVIHKAWLKVFEEHLTTKFNMTLHIPTVSAT
jgi:hypothetical protein